MLRLIILSALWSATAAVSIALTGDRKLLAEGTSSPAGAVWMIFNWKFIVAMGLAVFTRVLFIYINSAVVQIPSLASSATTVTAFMTAVSYPVVIATNAWMLGEGLSLRQYLGTALILAGIFVVCTSGGRS